MITFNVVREQRGWAIRTGSSMSTPFRSRDMAIREAISLADAIGCHGECVEVIVEGEDLNEPPRRVKGAKWARLDALLRGRRAGS